MRLTVHIFKNTVGPRMGLFNANALLITDLTLIIQIIIFIVLAIGLFFKRKVRYAKHGALMGIAVALHTISIVAAMVPSFSGFEGSTFLGQIITIHAIMGILVEILGVWLVIAWLLHAKDIKTCTKKKNVMRIIVGLWLLDLILGVYIYVLLYVPI